MSAAWQRRYRQDNPGVRAADAERKREARATRKAETVSRMLAMLNSGELAAYGTEPYFLYRFYDEDDTLLYIGITNDPERRLYQHTAQKPWADDIARTEYAVFANKTEATAAEAALIKQLSPLHNIVHNSVIKIPLTANENRQNGQH